MNDTVKVVNALLVELFNEILTVEKTALQESPFKDLSITEMHVLEAIGMTSRTMTDVAEQLGITVGTLTTSINRLVKKEYVIRNRSKDDRRFVEIELSHRGKLAYRIHEAFHAEMVRYMIEELANDDHQVLIDSLKRVSDFFRAKYRVSKTSGKD